VTVSSPAEAILPVLVEGMQSNQAQSAFGDTPLRTAVDLFSAQFSERSPEGRLLTLSMALEVLAPHVDKPPLALGLIAQWQVEIESLRGAGQLDDEESAGLEALERELLFRREASIRSRIRRLVSTTDFGGSEEERSTLVRRALKAYDGRSTLLHKGALDSQRLSEALEDAQSVVRQVLRARLSQAVGGRA